MTKSFKCGFVAALVCALAAAPAIALANPIFTDNFDSDSSSSVLNFTGFTNWTVSNGSVDYLNGYPGIACHGNAGGCVDLDGSTNDAGILTSKSAFQLTAGTQYTLSFWLSGNQRNSAADSVAYGVGTETGSITAIPGNQAFTQYFLTFTPSSDVAANIFFSAAGGDSVGPILDDVQLSTAQVVGVPEPGALAMLTLGLLALGLLRVSARRKHRPD